jgi:uncharacterized protein YoxC
MDGEKKRLTVEIASLRSTQKDIDDLKAKVDSLDKALAGSKAAEQLVLERAQRVNETAEGLRKEVDVERESSGALVAQVNLLTKRLDEVKAISFLLQSYTHRPWLALVV